MSYIFCVHCFFNLYLIYLLVVECWVHILAINTVSNIFLVENIINVENVQDLFLLYTFSIYVYKVHYICFYLYLVFFRFLTGELQWKKFSTSWNIMIITKQHTMIHDIYNCEIALSFTHFYPGCYTALIYNNNPTFHCSQNNSVSIFHNGHNSKFNVR